MAYSTTPTVAAGDVFPAAHWNTYVRGNLNHLADPPRCLVVSTANQTGITTAGAALTFTNEAYDTDAMHSTASNPSRITFITPGYYAGYAIVQLTHSTVAGGYKEVQVVKNGTDIVGASRVETNSTAVNTVQTVPFENRFGTNDYVEVKVAHTYTGATLDSVANSAGSYTQFAARWVAQYST